ncbi:MAG: NADPH-dependent 7-cyano-7-deazaguanine reductase QueF [Gammaproteobacteria bacterium]|jgi:7-cyano-7-deazaguanine reductase|nr:NADPH-dependent 7-cyano-7-deazaguanine reductase QueF [Gammaproteobacteria bacterium]
MDQEKIIEASPLGDKSEYVTDYSPELLFPIPRKEPWRPAFTKRPFYGVDIWNAYEISWLDQQGVPHMALGEFRLPGDSPNIIESKSFKLYLNSFNQTSLSGRDEVEQLMQTDLSKAAGAPVQVRLFGLNDHAMPIIATPGECIDGRKVDTVVYKPDASLLATHAGKYRTETLHSHLLKSNCPVTGQPDWATLVVEYEGATLDRSTLLEYIISYRQHGDFHEQCVEQIFLDIMAQCQPKQLTVYARYVRRGGLDINPYRSTKPLNPANCRTERQ